MKYGYVRVSTKEQNIDRHRPIFDTGHEFFGRVADIAEHSARHHAHQKQGETAVNAADFKLDGTETHRQENECHRNGHTLASRMEEAFDKVQCDADECAHAEGEHDLDERLDQDTDNAD